MIDDVDVWRAAGLLIKRHGDDAGVVAAQRPGLIESRQLQQMEDIVTMVDAYRRPEPTFRTKMTKDGTYCVLMDQHLYAPILHIGSFASEDDANAWITDESAAWFAKRVAAGMRDSASLRELPGNG